MYADSHCHLNGYADDVLTSLLANARANGVETFVAIAGNLDTSRENLELARRIPDVLPAVGIHPWHAAPLDVSASTSLKQLASQKGVVALGEVGIDLVRQPSTRDIQLAVFRAQLTLAKELDLPVMLHCRGADDETLDVIRAHLPMRGVIHGFLGSRTEVQFWLDLGLCVGIGVRAFARDYAPYIEDAVRSIPLDRLLLETDSSFASCNGPEALQPAKVAELAERVAQVHGCTPEEVGRRTSANLRAMLRLT